MKAAEFGKIKKRPPIGFQKPPNKGCQMPRQTWVSCWQKAKVLVKISAPQLVGFVKLQNKGTQWDNVILECP